MAPVSFLSLLADKVEDSSVTDSVWFPIMCTYFSLQTPAVLQKWSHGNAVHPLIEVVLFVSVDTANL